ncbi:hypothetical protein OIM99_27770 [Methylocella sp. CPCC 101449]|nr:hypothetical protein [Methylocella sp. CPCC 101449]MDT2024599.1 hypothetical protein [Methylocella sp. CPCC 101449]
MPNFNLMPNAHAVDANSNQHSQAVKTSCSAEDAIGEAAEDHRPRPAVATRNNALDKADARHGDQL